MSFDPSKYLTRLKGKEYLEVKWRLVWLRTDHPDAQIETQLVEHEPGKRAVVKAVVDLQGEGSASGYGSETAADFGDYLEKAETKAIGRALAALGYGTQFTGDFDEGQDRGGLNVVDSPVARPGAANGSPVEQTDLRKLYQDGLKLGAFTVEEVEKLRQRAKVKSLDDLVGDSRQKMVEWMNVRIAKATAERAGFAEPEVTHVEMKEG